MTKDDIRTLIEYIPDMEGYETNATLQDIESALVQLKTENERLREALNLIAENGDNQNAWDFDNYWYSEYAHSTAEKALGGE